MSFSILHKGGTLFRRTFFYPLYSSVHCTSCFYKNRFQWVGGSLYKQLLLVIVFVKRKTYVVRILMSSVYGINWIWKEVLSSFAQKLMWNTFCYPTWESLHFSVNTIIEIICGPSAMMCFLFPFLPLFLIGTRFKVKVTSHLFQVLVSKL